MVGFGHRTTGSLLVSARRILRLRFAEHYPDERSEGPRMRLVVTAGQGCVRERVERLPAVVGASEGVV